MVIVACSPYLNTDVPIDFVCTILRIQRMEDGNQQGQKRDHQRSVIVIAPKAKSANGKR